MPVTSRSFLKAFSLVYLSLVVALILFPGLVLYLINARATEPSGDRQFGLMMRYGLFAFTPIAAIAGFFIYGRLLQSIPSSTPLAEKLLKLRGFVLIRTAFLEFPGLVSAVVALMTADTSFLLFTAIMLVLLLLYRPTVARIAEDLRLSPEETDILENPDSVLMQ
jgi:hypothetical protein